MPTEITIEYADPFIPWWSTATSIDVKAWVTLNGIIVGGDPDTILMPADRTAGNILDDLTATITAVLELLTGDTANPYTPLDQYLSPGFGVGSAAAGNVLRGRPFVAIACQASYDWGLLNIPSRVAFIESNKLVWNFRFEATTVGSAESSPAWNALMEYIDEFTTPPTLMVLELDPS